MRGILSLLAHQAKVDERTHGARVAARVDTLEGE